MVGRGSNSASARGGDSMTEEQKRERRREQKRRSSAKGRERLKTIEGTKKYKKMEAVGRKDRRNKKKSGSEDGKDGRWQWQWW